ncbi:MAG: MFS transporter [Parvibaculaceae bacterium]
MSVPDITPPGPPTVRAEVQARRVLYVSLIGMLATGFPFTILTVAIGQMAADFGVTEAFATWTVSAPMLISAVCLPLLGKLGDMYGHRRVFLAGIAGSTVFAGLCFVAWDIWSLIVFRVLSMVLAGATTPSAMALLFHVFEDEERTEAISWWSMGGPGSAALGLILGGPLVDLMGWRSVFLFQIVSGAVAWVFAIRALPETPKRPALFDHLGNLVLIVALLFILFAVGTVSESAVPASAKWGAVAAGCAGLAIFLWYETRISNPIVPLALLRARNFNAPVATSFLLQAAYLGGLVATPLVLIGHFGYSISVAAGMMLLRTASLTVASPVGGKIAARYGERFGALCGTCLQAAGLFLVGAGVYLTSVPVLALGLVLQGVGHGFALPPLTSVIATAVAPALFGTASGVSRLVSQVGSSLGLSFFGALISYPTGNLGLPLIFAIGGALTLTSLVPAVLIRSSPGRRPT